MMVQIYLKTNYLIHTTIQSTNFDKYIQITYLKKNILPLKLTIFKIFIHLKKTLSHKKINIKYCNYEIVNQCNLKFKIILHKVI